MSKQLQGIHLHPEIALEYFVSGRRGCGNLVGAAGFAHGKAEKQELGQCEPQHNMNQRHGISRKNLWNLSESDDSKPVNQAQVE